jgi:serine carboxypeptidase 1
MCLPFLFHLFMYHPFLNPFAVSVACSYGGKMTTGFANALLAAMDEGSIKVNFKGVAMGDSWISGLNFVEAWGPLMVSLSLMDAQQLEELEVPVRACAAAVDAGNWWNATNYWGDVETSLEAFTDGVDFYNFLLHNQPDPALTGDALAFVPPYRRGVKFDPPSLEVLARHHLDRQNGYGVGKARGAEATAQGLSLSALMNGPIRKKLGVIPSNVTWGGQSGAVFQAQGGAFMKPVVDGVDALLAGKRINVTIYEGQVCEEGGVRWGCVCLLGGGVRWASKLSLRPVACAPSSSPPFTLMCPLLSVGHHLLYDGSRKVDVHSDVGRHG